MVKKSSKIFNEKKYQKNRKVLNFVGMFMVIFGILIGASVMYLGYNIGQKIIPKNSISSSLTGTTDQVILYDGSLVPTPTTKDEYQAAIAKVGIQYPDESLASSSDKMDLKIAYERYIESSSSNNNGIMSSFNSITNMVFSVQNILFTIVSLFPGLIVMLVGISLGSKILVIANGRGILGFFAQTAAPVMKESTEYMAPAYGKVAKEISKGWNSGKSTKKSIGKKK